MQYVIIASTLLFAFSCITGIVSRSSLMPTRCAIVVVSFSLVVSLASWYLNETPRCHQWLRQMGFGSGDKFEFLSLDLLAMGISYLGGTMLISGWGYLLGRLTQRFAQFLSCRVHNRAV